MILLARSVAAEHVLSPGSGTRRGIFLPQSRGLLTLLRALLEQVIVLRPRYVIGASSFSKSPLAKTASRERGRLRQLANLRQPVNLRRSSAARGGSPAVQYPVNVEKENVHWMLLAKQSREREAVG